MLRIYFAKTKKVFLFFAALSCVFAAAALRAAPVLYFNGANAYVNMAPKRYTGLTNLTLEVWIKASDLPSTYGSIVGNGYLADTIGFGIFTAPEYGGTVTFQARNGSSIAQIIAPYQFDGQWHHLAGVREGNASKLYIDGVFMGESVLQLPHINPSANFAFGARDVGSFGFWYKGSMAEVRLWDYAKSQAEIQALLHLRLIGSEQGLLGYWPTEEGSGATVFDNLAGGNAHGTIYNAVWTNDDTLPVQRGIFVMSDAGLVPRESEASPALGTDFQIAVMNLTARERTYTITNAGNATINLVHSPAIVFAAGDTNDFIVAAQPGITSLQPGGSTTFTLRFAPVTFGSKNATVQIATDQPFEPTYKFKVCGKSLYYLPPDAIGGEISVTGGWFTHTFTHNDTFKVFRAGEAEMVVVGGGGGGGGVMGGGGGAGGVIYQESFAFSQGDYPAVIGGGGLGGVGYNNSPQAGAKGEDSSFGGSTAIGGGGGGGWTGHPSTIGGSGGGGNSDRPASAGTPGQGNAGNIGSSSASMRTGGGGGGAGKAGALGMPGLGGKGGDGLWIIDGYLGGGGGGGLESSVYVADGGGPGGLGGGGAGSKGLVKAIDGLPNTGGGGGGGGYYTSSTLQLGGNGGSGVVKIRYFLPIQNLAATNISTSEAWINGVFNSTGYTAKAVSVYWGTSDGGTNPAAWANFHTWPAPQTPQVYSRHITGLSADNAYFYRYVISDAQSNLFWTPDTAVFITGDINLTKVSDADEATLTPGIFKISRSPALSTHAMNIGYKQIAGTAVAGIDFEPLPGVARFEAGQSEKQIPVVPLKNNNEFDDTTIRLALTDVPGIIGPQPDAWMTIIAQTPIHVSPFGNNTDGKTWLTAFTNMPNALAVAQDNDSIIVGDGVYETGVTLNINKKLVIRSVNGPEATAISRLSGVMRVFLVSNEYFRMSGFTISKGSLTTWHDQGSAIYMYAGMLSNCIITGNSHVRGSAAYLIGSKAVLTDSIITNNNETYNSDGCGGVRLGNGASMFRCHIADNKAGSESPGVMGVYMAGNSFISECYIGKNRYYDNARIAVALRMAAGDTARNCLIADNPGRGVQMGGGLLENCTVTRNNVFGGIGHGIEQTAGTVRNCIIWANGKDNLNNINSSGGEMEYSDSSPLQPGNGNVCLDPLFIDPVACDYHLYPASPIIDAGTNQPWMIGAVDLDQTNRIQAQCVDMGCFEAHDPATGPLNCNFNASPTEGLTNVLAQFTSTFVGANTNVVYWRWDFGDGNVLEGNNLAIVTNLYTTPGCFDVSLTATNTGGETTAISKQAYIYVAPIIAYVATNGAGLHPYDTWAKATTNFQDAIDVARISDNAATMVMVSNGVFYAPQELMITKGIVIKSVNGPEATTITRSGTCRIFNVNHSNALVTGFTVTNGTGGGGSGFYIRAGTVSNCVIDRCRHDRGSALAVSGPNSLFTHGKVINNKDQGNYFDCGGVSMSAGCIEYSLVTNNVAGTGGGDIGGLKMSGGVARNITIIGNSHGSGGYSGGVELTGGRLVNCLIAGNLGRGIYQTAGSIQNCTIARNTLEGLWQTGGGITNSIIALNNNGGVNITGGGGLIRHCCSPDLPNDPHNSGNISGDPGFVDPGIGDGPGMIDGDFRLTVSTSCINAGQNEDWMWDATDLAGLPRIMNGRVEIGAYELHPDHGTVLAVY